MSKIDESIKEYLSENLSINISTYRDYYDEGIEVEIILEGEVISSSKTTIDTKCSCKDNDPW